MSSAPGVKQGWRLFWVSLAAASVVAALAMFGWHDASVWNVERGLTGRVNRALEEAGFGRLIAEMDGQTVFLAGAAPDAAAKASAIRTALGAAGPGGPWAGGVTAVNSEDLIIGPPVSPYVWRATRRGRNVVLSGFVPTHRVKRALREHAFKVFKEGQAADHTHVAPGAPNAQWATVAADAITQLARLTSGEARLADRQLVLIGEGPETAVEAVNARYRGAPLPAPYRARLEINPAGEGVRINDLGDLDLSNPQADTCQAAFGGLMAQNVINFDTGSATIDSSSRRLLDQLASVAFRCDRFEIEIAGHTDNIGPRDANLDLSRRRAQAVLDYLAGQGVARDRLHAVGYGPDRPIASNANAVGQAANRRIEFAVSS